MRIRKRKVPLPLSLLSPVPLSDPHDLFSRSPVTVQQLVPSHPNTPLLPQPSDHLPPTSSHSSASDLRRRFIVGDTMTTAVKEQLFCWGFERGERKKRRAIMRATEKWVHHQMVMIIIAALLGHYQAQVMYH